MQGDLLRHVWVLLRSRVIDRCFAGVCLCFVAFVAFVTSRSIRRMRHITSRSLRRMGLYTGAPTEKESFRQDNFFFYSLGYINTNINTIIYIQYI